MDKSIASMAIERCVHCGKQVPTDMLLIDKQLQNSLERYTEVDITLCDTCRAENLVILLEVEDAASQKLTGRYTYVMFNPELPDDHPFKQSTKVLIDKESYEEVIRMYEEHAKTSVC